MATYQDVISAQGAVGAWAFAEAAGLNFAPYIGGSPLAGAGTFAYRQPGPFATAFGLRINVAAKLTLSFVQTVQLPVTFETWVNVTLPLAVDEFIFYNGNAALNGNGIYIQHGTSHLKYFAGGGIADVDLNVIWPSSGWHLFDIAQDVNGVVTLAIDGSVAFRGFVAAALAPVPNVLTIGGSSSTTSSVVMLVAMAAYYITALTPQQMAADFQAATDPNAALASAGTTTAASLQNILGELALIYAAVHKTY